MVAHGAGKSRVVLILVEIRIPIVGILLVGVRFQEFPMIVKNQLYMEEDRYQDHQKGRNVEY